jgi:hypothetical protein
MPNKGFLRIALLALLVLIFQGTWALAGTTGSLSGAVVLTDGTALAGAKVTATSPSESDSTTTDATGHFGFVSLTPDTYTVTITKDGYDSVSESGVTVQADATQTVTLHTQLSARVLGHVTTTSSAALVKPGTTSDVYSVNAATNAKVSGLGGGGSLDQAYGAIAATPGVVVPPGQMGWFQTIHIRGGDFDQVGYEFDGVPVLRSYDNYPTNTASSLGQQELQVYTGGAPANSESQGLAGYINQVIKSGTYPGYANLDLGIGAPTFYNKVSLEAGGATPDRNFSYYVAFGDSSQDFRYFDNSNGADLQSLWGTPMFRAQTRLSNGSCVNSNNGSPATNPGNDAGCYAADLGPGGYVLGPPVDSVNVAQVWDHESVMNLHFALPHKNDAGKDDIQLLVDNSYLHNSYYSSASDWGLPTTPYYQQLNGGSAFQYLSGPGVGWQYMGRVGTALGASTPAGLQGLINPVYFAYNPASQLPPQADGFTNIPTNQRDGTANPNSIIKLQYQRNIGTSSYLRIYGFDDYSEWPQTCPNTGWTNFVGYCPLNYYVQTTTSGVSTQYANQINDKNLINLEVSDFWANDYRANDDTMLNQFGLVNNFAYAVDSAHPTNGVCYSSGVGLGAPSAGTPVSCYSGYAQAITLGAAAGGSANLGFASPTCGTSACEWFVAENGQYGGGNEAKPNFGWASLSDEWKPTDKLDFNLGARYTRYFYQLSNTDANPARNFWFNSWNQSACVLPGAGQVPFINTSQTSLGACPLQNGVQTVQAVITNEPNATTNYTDIEPRIGATYSVSENDVLRVNYGRYNQPPNTAYEQYNVLQQDLASYDATNFWPIGFTTTTHPITPPTSNNYDGSWEHHFANSDTSFKLTPFLRKTSGQIQNFFLNQKTNFVSGLNAGNQTSDGVEFELTKGDFNQNGLSGLFSFTYTHSYINYSTLANGGSVLSTVNVAIQNYNSFTKACATASPSSNPNALCGTAGNANALPTDIAGNANPYYNAPIQPLFNLNGDYVPFSTIPGAVEAADSSYETPVDAALVLNFKHDKWAFTPQFQFFEGGYYGDPLTGYGIVPGTCGAPLASSITGDPRYPYGSTGGAPYDATTCTGTMAIPDPYTHKFDNIGAFRLPNQELMHMQIAYEMSSRVTLSANLSNIINTCSGGTSMPWTQFANNKVCSYTLPGYGAPLHYGSNFYNPSNAGANSTTAFQPMVEFPYQENPTILPFTASFNMSIKM